MTIQKENVILIGDEEIMQHVQAELNDWQGDNYDYYSKTYRSEFNVGKKVYHFELNATLDDDGVMYFDDIVSVKRVR